MNKKQTQLCVVIADTQVGSTLSVCPKGYHDSEGAEVALNPYQEGLIAWERFWDWVDEIAKGDPFDLVLNGDLVEGNRFKGGQYWSVDMEDQVGAAIELLAPKARRAENVFVTYGTQVHGNKSEMAIARALRAVPTNVQGKPVHDRLFLEYECEENGEIVSKLCLFKHHIGVTTRPYLEASQHSIHLGTEIIEAIRDGQRIPDVICFGHRHKFGTWQDSERMTVVGHPWQLATRYAHKVVPNPAVRTGGYMLDFREIEDGLPRLRRKTFKIGLQQQIINPNEISDGDD